MTVTTPTVTATWDDTAKVVVVGISGYGTATTYTLWRVVNGFFAVVRGAYDQAVTEDTVVDAEFPQNTEFTYTASVTDGVDTESASTGTLGPYGFGFDVLAAVGVNLAGVPIKAIEMDRADYGVRAEVVTVVGRAGPVAVSDVTTLPRFTLRAFTTTRDHADKLRNAVLASPLFVFLPAHPEYAFEDGQPIYATLIGLSESLFVAGANGGRLWDIEAQRIDPPLVPLISQAPADIWLDPETAG